MSFRVVGVGWVSVGVGVGVGIVLLGGEKMGPVSRRGAAPIPKCSMMEQITHASKTQERESLLPDLTDLDGPVVEEAVALPPWAGRGGARGDADEDGAPVGLLHAHLPVSHSL